MDLIRALSEISADLPTGASLLLLDEATAELIHWQSVQIQVDILPLISSEPHNIKIHILEEFLSSIQNEKLKGPVPQTTEVPVILCSSPLSQTALMECKRSILERYRASTVVCQNTAVHQQMRELVRASTAEVRLLRINCSNIRVAQDIHLVPAYNTLPAMPSDLYYWKGTDRSEQPQISTSYSLELQVLSEHILSLCEELGVVTDVFSLGASSRFLAKNLISTVKDREPAEFGKKASLILIDRTLDIVTALSHCGENLLDRVSGCYPDWSDSSSDVRIDMSRLFCDRDITPLYAPGTLSQPCDPPAQRLLRSMATLRAQEALLELVAALLDGLKERGQRSPLPQRLGRVTPAHLAALLEAYGASDAECVARHAGALQLAEGCRGCAEGAERSGAWDGQQSREKLLSLFLSQDAADCAAQVALQLREVVESAQSLQQLLATLLHVMLASSDVTVREGVERVMLGEVSRKIEGEGRENFLEGLPEDLKKIARNKASQRLWLDDIIVKFKDLCELQYSPQQTSETPYRASAAREPVLRELMSALLSGEKVEELEYHPASFGEGLMSSLGYYMGKSQSFEKKPASNNIIIVFMLGGVTGKEIKCLTDINGQMGKRNHRIVIASTRLATPARTLASIIDPKHLY